MNTASSCLVKSWNRSQQGHIQQCQIVNLTLGRTLPYSSVLDTTDHSTLYSLVQSQSSTLALLYWTVKLTVIIGGCKAEKKMLNIGLLFTTASKGHGRRQTEFQNLALLHTMCVPLDKIHHFSISSKWGWESLPHNLFIRIKWHNLSRAQTFLVT